MLDKLKYLLLQVRNPDDVMRMQEVQCFARALRCDATQILPFDLLTAAVMKADLESVDVVLLGGSGHYGAVNDAPWLDRALESLREIHELSKPTFASCWGFQAMSRAMGGVVVKDLAHAELGTHHLGLTAAGREDPVFGPLGETFTGQMGHEDRVIKLPPDAILLASTNLVENQAFRFADKPIYCTQFHPELRCKNLLERLEAYPEYVERISGLPMDEFIATCKDTPEAEALLTRFVDQFVA